MQCAHSTHSRCANPAAPGRHPRPLDDGSIEIYLEDRDGRAASAVRMEIELRVPKGARSGDTLQIDTGSVEMEIEIPAGLGEGDAFTVVVADGPSEEEEEEEEDHVQRQSVAGSVQDARAAAWGLNGILKQAKQYAEQQRRMQEQLASALPQGIQSPGKPTTPVDALLAWLRTFPSVTSSWSACLRAAR